ncbi:MAG: TetR family transcriptional regulator [Flammeovirgaceae bacterium]|nr:TetR family transcriptional regulator [Flammeovirgaceae bacterium]MBE61309.1 TetR family transcriptional regulator [Flammeovirgaceae bacterium]MBR09858.1 TetR family transcriptional regulator [Rickettsiales bacterium]|tara:strand:- start:7344 stop:7946 length:603 start_codon:yes stop_codon:yes gene_type:complete
MEEQSTEDKIKEAARKVFITKGMTGARMQEIADLANINKALLHYYYRSKEQLFHAIFDDIIQDMLPGLFSILNSRVPLEVKVYQLADKYMEFLSKRPELPLFVMNELQRHPDQLIQRLNLNKGIDFTVLKEQLEEEYQKGNIREITVEMFILNLISLLVFPFAGRILFKSIAQMEESSFAQFMELRKTEVPKFVMNALRP